MKLSRQYIERLIDQNSGNGGGGNGGGGTSVAQVETLLAGYATQKWTDEKYLSIDFFNHLVAVHGKKTETVTVEGQTTTTVTDIVVAPNEWPVNTETVTYEVTDIEVKYTLWSQGGVSALGYSGDASGGGGGGGGSVTSVGLSMPTGFMVTNTPITQAGTLTVGFATGYSLPTTAKQNQWDEAYAAKHTHDNLTVLNGITADLVTKWNAAFADRHAHENMSVLEGITATLVTNWNTAFTNNHTHSNKAVLDTITSTKVEHWDTAYGWGNHAAAGYLTQAAFNATTWWGNSPSNGAVTGNLVGAIQYIEFSNGVRIGVDSTSNTLKVYRSNDTAANIYATGGVSALGMSDDSSHSTFDEGQMWDALGGSMLNKQIAASHLSNVTKNLTLTVNGNTYVYNGTEAKAITITAGTPDRLAQYALADGASLATFTHSTDLIYTAKGGSNTNTDKPTGVDSFGLISFKTASGYYGQLLVSNDPKMYLRTSNSLQDVAWKEIAFTDGTVSKADAWTNARNFSIASSDNTGAGTAVSVNGSQNVTLLLPSTIKASLTGNASTATTLQTTRTLWGRDFNGSQNVRGNIDDADDITINTSKGIFMKDSNGNAIRILRFSDPNQQQSYAGNELLIGYGLRNSTGGNIDYNMTLYGQVVNINHGGSGSSTFWTVLRDNGHVTINADDDSNSSNNIFLSVGGNIRTAASNGAFIQIGDIRIVYDNAGTNGNNALKIVKSDGTAANFYATGGISALGQSDNSSPSTFDEGQMWDALGGSMLNKQIAASHLSSVTKNLTVTINGTTYNYNGTNAVNLGTIQVTGNYLPLTGGTLRSSSHQVLELATTNTDTVKWVGLKFKYGAAGNETEYGGLRIDEQDGSLFRYNHNYTTFKLWDEGNDGTGSGLDADLLDGQHGSYYATASSVMTLQGYFTGNSANSAKTADKLTTARSLWGNSFNGSSDLTGSLRIANNNSIYIKNTSNSDVQLMYFDNSNTLFLGNSSNSTHLKGTNLYFHYGTTNTQGMVLTSGGKLGIGTDNPDYKLSVNGDTELTGDVNMARSKGVKFKIDNTYTMALRLFSGSDILALGYETANDKSFSTNIYGNNISLFSGSSLALGMILTSAGKVGIGTDSPGNYRVKIIGNTVDSVKYGLIVDGTSTLSGNVGIGTAASSTYRLCVSGQSYFNNAIGINAVPDTSKGTLYVNGSVCIGGAVLEWDSANNALKVRGTGSSSASMNFYATGGVSALGPSSQTTGQVNISSTTGTSLILNTSTTYNCIEFHLGGTWKYSVGTKNENNTNYFYIYRSSSQSGQIFIDNSCNVGVGIYPQSGYKFYVSGKSGGTTAWTNNSDINMKNVEKKLNPDVKDFAEMPLFRFTWKDKSIDKDKHIGTSAQYVRDILPELVTNIGGHLGLDYAGTALAAAISVARKTLTHEEEIKRLKAKVAELEEEVEQLKAA